MLSSGLRKAKNIDIEEAFYYIRKAKLIALLYAKEEPIFLPVGLGEPLCNPDLLEIMKYASYFFGRIQLTTNATLLTPEKIDEILSLEIESIQVSMSYFDDETYKDQIGLDMEMVKTNVLTLFKKRNALNSKTKIITHIFDNELNSKKERDLFWSFYSEYLIHGDALDLRPYFEIVDNGTKGNLRDRSREKYVPCNSLWTDLTISIEGNVFPCCLGLWKKYDLNLSLGHISDNPVQIVRKLINIRVEHQRGVFKNCIHCQSIKKVIPYDHRTESIDYPELLEYVNKNQRFFIYGAGLIGKKINGYLKLNGFQALSFVTTGEPEECELDGLKVVSLSRVLHDFSLEGISANSYVFVIAAMSPYKEEIVEVLKRKGVESDRYFIQEYFPLIKRLIR